MSARVWFLCIPAHHPFDGNGLPDVKLAWVIRRYFELNEWEKLPDQTTIRYSNRGFFSPNIGEGTYHVIAHLDESVTNALEITHNLDAKLRSRLVEQIERLARGTLWYVREWERKETAKSALPR